MASHNNLDLTLEGCTYNHTFSSGNIVIKPSLSLNVSVQLMSCIKNPSFAIGCILKESSHRLTTLPAGFSLACFESKSLRNPLFKILISGFSMRHFTEICLLEEKAVFLSNFKLSGGGRVLAGEQRVVFSVNWAVAFHATCGIREYQNNTLVGLNAHIATRDIAPLN